MRPSHRRLVTSILVVLVVILTISTRSIQAEEYQYNQNDDAAAEEQQDDADMQDDGVDQQDQQVEEQQGGNQYYYNYDEGEVEEEAVEEEAAEEEAEEEEQQEDGTVYNTFTVCSDAVIQVQDVKIYCDSPGTFYYGSGKYRNSPSCVPGDKGKIIVDFYIAQPDVIQQAGGYVIVDISASGNGGWYQSTKQVFENADLCSLNSLHKKSGTTCPFEGKYRIQTHFYWDKGDNSYLSNDRSFYPKVTVGFKSNIRNAMYDYGGANTMYCRGSSFVTWTQNVGKTYANAIGNFIKTFGILLLTIAFMGGFVWFMVNRPTSVKDAGQKMGIMKRDVFLDEDFDFSKIKSPKNGQNLVDF